jgi:hypothetical protein
MAVTIRRISDDRYLPHLYKDGTYHLHLRGHGSERNKSRFATCVASLEEVAKLLRTGDYVLRMSYLNGPAPALVKPDDIEVIG